MTDDVKVKVESLLFLVDKFEVSDKFALEMTIVFENLPISYLVKESRHKIENNYIYIYIPFPAVSRCARKNGHSFKEKLAYELNSLVCYNHDINVIHLTHLGCQEVGLEGGSFLIDLMYNKN